MLARIAERWYERHSETFQHHLPPNQPIIVYEAFFFDGGVAWTSDNSPTFTNGGRSPVSSYGVSLRANALGFLIAQISCVHPNDRPMQNWIWEFSLMPGF